MEITPYDYQEDLIEGIKKEYRKGKRRVVMCLPTGGGKTVVFSTIAKRTIERDPNAVIFIVTHRTELLKQGGGTLEGFGLKPFYVTSKTREGASYDGANIFVCMIESLKSRHMYLPKPTLIIIDEAHIGNFIKLNEWYDCRQILATATPINSNKKKPMKSYADSIVVGLQVNDLINKGKLSDPYLYASPLDFTGLKKDNKGEYTEASQMEVFDKREVYDGLEMNIEKYGAHKKTLVFCSSIAHTEAVTEALKDMGLNAVCIHSKQEDKNGEERANVLKWFKETPAAYLVNCGILTAGFDEPTIERVILLRATTSVGLFMQMVGRGARVTPQKNSFEIFDFGDNSNTLGRWEDPRPWEYTFYNPPKAGEGIAPMKDCPKCEYMMAAPVMECPECGHIFESKEKEKKAVLLICMKRYDISEDKAEKIYDITEDLKNISEGKKESLMKKSAEIFKESGMQGLKAFSKMMDYKQGFAHARKKQLDMQNSQIMKESVKAFQETKKISAFDKAFSIFGGNAFVTAGEMMDYKAGWAWRQIQETKNKKELF